MPRARLVLSSTAVWLILLVASIMGEDLTPSPLANHLLVVYNSQEPTSKELAEYYASMRSIPPERVLGIPCSKNEEITREEYEKTIRRPIEDYIISKGWMTRKATKITTNLGVVDIKQSIGNNIWAIALIRGIPLKIAEDPGIPFTETIAQEFRTNKACVDSELALITFDRLPEEGHIGNVYFTSQGGMAYSQMFADYFIMVTRLDAPTPQLVKDMIRNSVETEKLRLTGRAVFDARGIRDPKDNYIAGDEWIREAARVAVEKGFEVTMDEQGEVIPAGVPVTDVAIYAGWYEADAKGFVTRGNFHFRPGAVAYHIHSFSGSTIRSETQNWVGPLISRGAVATMGAVYEPYLQFTPDVGSFYKSLLKGLTFAEAAYQSQKVLSWMVTFVGDPLYRPFARNVDDAVRIAVREKSPQQDWLLAQQARQALVSGYIALGKDTIKQATEAVPTAVTWESYGDMAVGLGYGVDEAIAGYAKAKDLAALPVDKIRIGLKIGQIYRKQRMADKALITYEKLIAEYPAEAAFYQVLQASIACASEAGLKQVSETLKGQLNIPNPSAKP